MFKSISRPGSDPGEINNLPSMTVPDQSYTVRDLLERFTTGVLPVSSRTPVYSDNPDFDNYDEIENPDFDLSDYHSGMLELEASLSRRKHAKDVEPEKLVASVSDENKRGSSAADDERVLNE